MGRVATVIGVNIPTVAITGVPDPLPEGLVVLDVREDDEWRAGHVEGAVHIPLGDLGERVAEVPTDQQVLVVCKVGGRSARATGWLAQRGVEAVNLDGGMLEWEGAGRPMVSEDGEAPRVV
ncbi:rhodanese-like domain-containing protein [Nocardioides nanhaiensis]|uniref:Rhodanese-like domain-containing protein n=1 Tax=Nocardioides nanhaiensis TaxID=1476871 RepID=A0ABP8WG60_9ACTN